MCSNQYGLAQRLACWWRAIGLIEKGNPYTKIKQSYVLFILDFKWIEDKNDSYIYKNEKDDNTEIPRGNGNPFVVVELPKVKFKEEMSLSEEYAFVLKCCTEEKYYDQIWFYNL